MLGRRAPTLSVRGGVAAGFGWAIASVGLFATAWRRGGPIETGGTGLGLWPDWVPLAAVIPPAVLSGLFVVWAVRLARSVGPGQRLGDKIARHGALWLGLYAIAWFAGCGLWRAAGIMAGLTAAGFVGMSSLRTIYALIEHPLDYRR